MPSQYVSIKNSHPLHKNRSIRVRCVKTHQVTEVRGGTINKSKECLFQDQEESYESLKDPTLVNDKELFGEVRITSSYDATKLHFNSSFDEFIESKSKLLSAIHSPVRSMSTATVLSQSTGLSDFRSGAVVVSIISNLLEYLIRQKLNDDQEKDLMSKMIEEDEGEDEESEMVTYLRL
nr:replication protein A 70 kDa DNA-binding subunit-like [Ipomoea batatas]